MRKAKTRWIVDPLHTRVQFKVQHLLITTITGMFKVFSGEVRAAEDFEDAEIRFEASVRSISTNNKQQEVHLKSADFFKIKKFPAVSFVSISFVKKGISNFQLNGLLTIRGITKKVKLDVKYGGIMTDPWGDTKAGFAVKGKINRKDFGLTWNATTASGGILIGEEVTLLADVQLLKQQPPALLLPTNIFRT